MNQNVYSKQCQHLQASCLASTVIFLIIERVINVTGKIAWKLILPLKKKHKHGDEMISSKTNVLTTKI